MSPKVILQNLNNAPPPLSPHEEVLYVFALFTGYMFL